jgi:DNA mismatch repair ATPase MutS
MDKIGKNDDNPILCFVDEVLRGTNTVERIAASTQILDKLSDNSIICFAATHDIELTHLLENKYDNFHFEEEVKNQDVIFPYHLLKGRSQTRNAIKLLEVIGFSEDIIDKANDMAKNFLEKGEWNNVC